MKNFWILALFTGFNIIDPNLVVAQSDTMRLYQIYSSLSNIEKTEWTAFENNWNYFEYTAIKKTCRVANLNCKNCESLYADIFLKIDNTGRLSTIHFLQGKKCGVACNEFAFISQFENSLKKQQFHSLKNKQFIARFGQILKC